jgi:GNAT superfamily N-acetyltransferase
MRRRGAGRKVVQACIDHARREGATRLWCHARVSARGFYERLGFAASGDVYDLPVAGPHVFMEHALRGQDPAASAPR